MDSLNRCAFNLLSEPLISISHCHGDLRPRINLKDFFSPLSNTGSNDVTPPFPRLAESVSATGDSSLVSKIIKIGSIAVIGGLSYLAWKKYGRKIVNRLYGEPEREAVYRWNHRMDIGGGGDDLARVAARAEARAGEDAARHADFAQYDAALARRMAAINALADGIDDVRAQVAHVASANGDGDDNDEWSDWEDPEMHVVCEGGDNHSGELNDTEYFRLYPAMGKGDADW